MRVLIVGGNGFIGSHLKDAFLASGLEVAVLDRLSERYRPALEGVQAFLGDLADSTLAPRALDGAEVVVYLSSTTVPQTSEDDPVNDIVANLFPLLRFLGWARRQGVRRLVFLSSGGMVYGPPSTLAVSETHPTQPIAAHGIVKLMMEKYILAQAATSGAEAVVLRVSNVYGERQDPFGRFGAPATFLGCAARRQPIVVWGDGETVRDYVYAKDIAQACLAAVTVQNARSVYNIGTGQGHSLKDLIGIIKNTIGDDHRLEIEWKARRSFDIPCIVLDSSLARRELGWEPKTALADGVRLTWEWVRTLPCP